VSLAGSVPTILTKVTGDDTEHEVAIGNIIKIS
jgi:flagellar basal-body rod modification protein FlgD